MIDYRLRYEAYGDFPDIRIDEERFRRLKVGSERLRAARTIEEHYEIVLANYKAIEKAALDLSLEFLVRGRMVDPDLLEVPFSLNLTLVNLLSAVRLYVDTLGSNVATCLTEVPSARTDCEKLRSAEYDANGDYRLMEALRNHVQHRGLPIHHWSLGKRWDDKQEHLEYSINYAANTAMLEGDEKFKKSVLTELPRTVDLQAAIRGYIDGVSRIHMQTRDLTRTLVDDSRDDFDRAFRDYNVVHHDFEHLHAVMYERGVVVESVLVMLKWDDLRLKLLRKNSRPTGFKQGHITSKNVKH